MTWNIPNIPSWKTKSTATWKNNSPITWWRRFQNAFWNAISYLWDDSVMTWDARSDDDDWKGPVVGTWYTKN